MSPNGLIAVRHHPLPQADSAFRSYLARALLCVVYANTFAVHPLHIDFNLSRKAFFYVNRDAHPFELDSRVHSHSQTRFDTFFRLGRVRLCQTDVVGKFDYFGGGV